MNIRSYRSTLWFQLGAKLGLVLPVSLALFLTHINSAIADGSDIDLSFSGFGTIGVVHNSNDTLQFNRELTTMSGEDLYSYNVDSLLGLQLNVALPANLDGVVQVILKDRVSNEILDSLELFFLRYRPDRHWAIRVGRTSADLYMLSEYRNVGYAYLWSRPITEFYELSSSIAKIDGIDVSHTLDLGGGIWENKLAYGQTHSVLNSDAKNDPFEIDLENVFVFTSVFNQAPWMFRLAMSYAEVDKLNFISEEVVSGLNQIPSSLWPEAKDIANQLSAEGQEIKYFALGMQYDSDSWIIQSELSYTNSDWGLLPSYYSGYISAGYRIDEVTLFGVFSHLDNSGDAIVFDRPELPVQFLPPELVGQIYGLHGGSQLAVDSVRGNQSTYSAGIRWDLYPNTTVKLQWDHSRVDMAGNVLWTKTQSQQRDQNVNIFSLNFSFIFNL